MGQLGDKRATDPQSQQKQTNFAVGNEVLAGGDFNARLMTEIRQNLGYTYGISGSMNPMLARGPYQIGFSTRNDKARAAIDASLAVINDTLEKGITSTEMRLTTDNLKNSFPMGFASNAGINGLLGMMNFYQLPNSYLTDYVKRIDQVQLSEVNQTMQDILKPDDFLIITVGQEDPWKDKKTNK
nr:insulinase family protein [Psychrobacter sp. JCM 18903]